MFELILYEPEIPPNTGNIIRLCANTGTRLHLVEPLGFDLSDRQLRRAGLDYHEYAEVAVHRDWPTCLAALAGRRLFALTTRASVYYDSVAYLPGEAFVLGPESRGLPDPVLEAFAPDRSLRLPMLPGSRSLNLSNTASAMIYEAWRQNSFEHGV